MKTQKEINEKGKAPRMMVYLFGEAAERAERGASARLLRWSEAFEGWLLERREMYHPGAERGAIHAWRNLLQQRGKMPWELCEQDFEEHIQWMNSKGYAASTIANSVGRMSSFFRWCDIRRIDPECEKGFNPAAGVKRPKVRLCMRAALMSEGERARLMKILEKDETALGRRDRAFFMMRLSLGVPLGSIQQLQWGQIETDGKGAWVRWRKGIERTHLGEEVWKAIISWLEASERLVRMKAESYIFSPLKDRLQRQETDGWEAWTEERFLSSRQLLQNLKIYGRKAGIEEGKLTLMALRWTATRLKLDKTEDLEEMKRFLDSREDIYRTKYRLKKLPENPPGGEEKDLEAIEAPMRMPNQYKEGEGLQHGLYAHRQPKEEVEAVMKSNLEGIDEEIAGMRRLAAILLERQGQASSSKEALLLTNAYTLTTYRLGGLIKAEMGLRKKKEEDQWVEKFLEQFDKKLIENGKEPVGEEARKEAANWHGGEDVGYRGLSEEIASVRVVIRRTLKLVEQANEQEEVDLEDLIRRADTYSNACNRLVRLMQISKTGQLGEYLNATVDNAIMDLYKEWGWVDDNFL